MPSRGNHARAKRPALWALGFAALTLLLRLPFVGLPFDPTDEGYYASVAQASTRGARLYADLWYVRPPFLNAVYAWSYRLSLGTHVPFDLSVRLLSALFAAATVGVLAWALFTEFSPGAAALGSAAGALMAASLALQNEANAETWMLLPYTLSALLVLYVAVHPPPARRVLWLMALAGALTGVAAAFKQVALVNLALPIAAWLSFDRAHPRRWLARAAAFVAGTAAVWAGVLLALAATDDVRAFLYYAWFRNAQYVGASRSGGYALGALGARLGGPLAGFAVLAVGVLALFAVGLVRSRGLTPALRIGLFALAWLGLSAIGVAASGRFYQHYFVQATVPLALLLSAAADAAFPAEKPSRVAAIALALVGVLLLLAPGASWVGDVRSAKATTAARQVYQDLGARELPRLTPPNGRVLVWGIYLAVKAYSPLQSATHVSVATYNYGWTPTDRGSLLGERFPSTADVMLPELRRSPPDTVVLTVPLPSPGAAPARNDGERLAAALYKLLARDYTVVRRGAGYVVLRRRG